MDQVYKPFSDRNGAKTLPFRAAHTSMAYIREYPQGGLQIHRFWCTGTFKGKGTAERLGTTSVVRFIQIEGKRITFPLPGKGGTGKGRGADRKDLPLLSLLFASLNLSLPPHIPLIIRLWLTKGRGH